MIRDSYLLNHYNHCKQEPRPTMIDPGFDPKFKPTEPTLTKMVPGWLHPSVQSQHSDSQPKDSELVNNHIASLKRQLHDARVALGKHEDFVKYNEQLIKSLESHIQSLVNYAELRQMETRS